MKHINSKAHIFIQPYLDQQRPVKMCKQSFMKQFLSWDIEKDFRFFWKNVKFS